MNLMDAYKQNRRTFIGISSGLASATLMVKYLAQGDAEAKEQTDYDKKNQILDPGPAWSAGPGKARHRYDGLAKVSGRKIYGRDFHAADMQGWPTDEVRVLVLRAHAADRIFLGVDVAKLEKDLKVFKVVTHQDFVRDHLKIPFYFGRIMMAVPGGRPDYLGQPVALAFIRNKDYLALLAIEPKFFDLSSYVQLGSTASLGQPTSYGMTRLTRYRESPTKDLFSVAQDGMSSPPWEAPDPKGSTNARCVYYGNLIEQEMQNQGWHIFSESYVTQSVDPCFMESESGIAWFEKKKNTLHLTLGTQSPYEDADACATIFADKTSSFRVQTVKLNACYPGGGFGGRDHSDFPLYLAIAAVYGDGKPIRIVYNRFEQFQAGIKRHPARIQEKIAVDNDGMIQALKTDIQLDGGGQNNFSFAVQAVAAQNATAAYYIPRVDIQSQALSSIAVTAGSMRGFGTLQAMFALESLVDQAAYKLKLDPIELRLINLLNNFQNTTMGGKPTYVIQSEKVLRAAQTSKFWVERELSKKTKSDSKNMYGVGFALALKSYGTNLDACLAAVEIAADGRVLVKSNGIDMGNGVATTLSLAVADLFGRNADRILMGVTEDFESLRLTSSFESSQAAEDSKAKNPRWVPYLSMSQAASAGAYQMRHAVRQAATLVLRHGVWPAACNLANIGNRTFDIKRIKWKQGEIWIDSERRIGWQALVENLYKQKMVSGAMVHAYYRSQWAEASFRIGNAIETLPIDALALRLAHHSSYTLLDRITVQMPPFKNNLFGVDMFTPYGLLVGVAVNKETGVVRVDAAEGYIDVGQMGQLEIVEGQAQGALAMGIGQTLFENLPLTKGGPGEGGWNFGRYRVPLMGDIPINRFKLHVIEPIPNDPPKGMSEVVECAVAPAIANAIAHATGKRFRELPISPDKVKGALG